LCRTRAPAEERETIRVCSSTEVPIWRVRLVDRSVVRDRRFGVGRSVTTDLLIDWSVGQLAESIPICTGRRQPRTVPGLSVMRCP
jgi:hypothetical protein